VLTSIYDAFGWRTLFFLTGGAGIVLIVPLYLAKLRPESEAPYAVPRPPRASGLSFAALGGWPFLLMVFSYLTQGMLFWGITLWIALAVRSFGFTGNGPGAGERPALFRRDRPDRTDVDPERPHRHADSWRDAVVIAAIGEWLGQADADHGGGHLRQQLCAQHLGGVRRARWSDGAGRPVAADLRPGEGAANAAAVTRRSRSVGALMRTAAARSSLDAALARCSAVCDGEAQG
jgi:hypothetical protein